MTKIDKLCLSCAQAAMQLTEEQTEALVRGYAEMTAKLRGIYSAQKTAVGYLAESAEQAPARSHGPEGDYVVGIVYGTPACDRRGFCRLGGCRQGPVKGPALQKQLAHDP